jgi:hypothetical protein
MVIDDAAGRHYHRAMRTTALLLLAVGGCGGGGGLAGDGGGSENGSLASARAYQQKCAPDAGFATATFTSCWGKLRPDYVDGFWMCMAASACYDSKADDNCATRAATSLSRSQAAQTFTKACLDRRTQCNGSFIDDYCAEGFVFRDDAVARAMACLGQACGAISACLKDAFGKPAGCP